MKINRVCNFLLAVIVLILSVVVTESVYCQPWVKAKSKYYKKIDNEYMNREQPVVEDTVTDREFSIDLEKLSRLAIIEAAGSNGGNINGLVILDIKVDTAGVLYSIGVTETSKPVLNPIAISALKRYFKKYKPKPAKKDGKFIETIGFLIPIVFDMSVLEDNKQTPGSSNK